MSYDIFLDNLSDNQQELATFWHQQFLDYPEVISKIRYRIPFYYYRSWLCYINPQKEIDGIELVFLQGKLMHDDSGLLQDRGRKMVAGILMTEIEESLVETVHELFAQAIIIDEDLAAKKR